MLNNASLNFAKPVRFKCGDEKSLNIGRDLLSDAHYGATTIEDRARHGEYGQYSSEKEQAAALRANLYSHLQSNEAICRALGRFVDLRNPENF